MDSMSSTNKRNCVSAYAIERIRLEGKWRIWKNNVDGHKEEQIKNAETGGRR